MKALQQIIKRVAEKPLQPWALATLVQTEGSTYRKPGARLLIEPDGKALGVLSGGCLEEEIARYGKDVIATGSPVLLSFDTRRLYGCDGRLKILIEPLPAAERNGNLITEIGLRLRNRQLCRIRICFEGDALGSELLPTNALLTERSGVFIETVPFPVRLLLFGSGPEIKPLSEFAGNLGWVLEHFGHPSELSEDFRPDALTAALVMNHNFGRDLLALDRLLRLRLRYIGLLGPRKRHAELLARLSEYRPLNFDIAMKNLFAPAGLDIGSEAPEEIALAIVSEWRRYCLIGSAVSCANAGATFIQSQRPLAERRRNDRMKRGRRRPRGWRFDSLRKTETVRVVSRRNICQTHCKSRDRSRLRASSGRYRRGFATNHIGADAVSGYDCDEPGLAKRVGILNRSWIDMR